MYCNTSKTGWSEKTVSTEAKTTTLTTLTGILPLPWRVEIHRFAKKHPLWMGTR